MQNLEFPDFPAYPAYKPSGIEWLGDIPSHWEVRRLKYLARNISQPTSEHAVRRTPSLHNCCNCNLDEWGNAAKAPAKPRKMMPFYGAGDSARLEFYGAGDNTPLEFYGGGELAPLPFYGEGVDADYVQCVNCGIRWNASEYLTCYECWGNRQ